MYKLGLLFCAFVVVCFEHVLASTGYKDCVDCRSIRLCEPALNFVRQQNNITPETRNIFLKAQCGYNNSEPMVCCLDFLPNEPNWVAIEAHPSLALLPVSCGDIDVVRAIPGPKARLYDFTWMGLVFHNTSKGLKFDCAGSVINSRYILTAAHCVTSHKGDNRNISGVRIGEFDTSTELDCEDQSNKICESTIQDIGIEGIIVHENYRRQSMQGDIALVRLQKDIDLSVANASPICLPVYKQLRERNLTGERMTIAGWNITERDANPSALSRADAFIKPDEFCKRYYRYQSRAVNGTFCASESNNEFGGGGSGSPLFAEAEYTSIKRYVQFGITSFGPSEGSRLAPRIYTDVTKYMRWILDNIRS